MARTRKKNQVEPIVLGEGRIVSYLTVDETDAGVLTLYRMPVGLRADQYSQNPDDVVAVFRLLPGVGTQIADQMAVAVKRVNDIAEKKNALNNLRRGG